MKKTDIAYVAGLFDGEGCISINKNSSKYKYYTLNVSVKMSWEWMPKFLHLCFGGSIRLCKMDKYYPNAKDQWSWQIWSWGALEFLKTVLPYLKVKRAEAELAILFQGNKLHKSEYLGKTHRGKSILSEEQKAVEEARYFLMRNLKR